MRARCAALGIGTLAMALAAGCGPQVHPTVSNPSGTVVLKPTAIHQPAQPYVTSETLRAALTGAGTDAVHVATSSGHYGVLSGMLTVTSPSGRVLLHLPHVGWAGILEFGRSHVPVVVTRSDAGNCGSGGCEFVSYSWVGKAEHFGVVRAPSDDPAAQPRYAWNANEKRLRPVAPPKTARTNAMFGFAALTSAGLTLAIRTYDLNQNVMNLRYAFAPAVGSAGAWVAQGTPTYAPQTLVGPYPSGPMEVAEELLDAIAMNLPRQVEALSATPRAGRAFMRKWRPLLGPLGPLVYDPQSFDAVQAAQGAATELVIWQLSGRRGGMTLHVMRAALRFQGVEGQWRVASLGIAPVALQVNTVAQVLSRLARNPSVAAYLASHSGVTVDQPGTQGPTTWVVELSSGGSVTVDARSGAVNTAGMRGQT